MCGFVGIYSRSGQGLDTQQIRQAGRILSHRGPDDQGFYADNRWAVSFQRLSILDTSSRGRQPMQSDDGRFVLVFNGEIYNFRELRGELRQQGHVFRGKSDTEVLLRAFEQWGQDCLSRLRGMFAFAIWDSITSQLFVARDRLGIKPLYWYRDENRMILASEIKGILACLDHSPELDHRSIFKYLARCWVDDTQDTFYSSIKSVPPGHYLVIQENRSSLQRYWSVPSLGQASFNREEFQEEFGRTINLHLRSDVPLACTLSGGMDSSSIVVTAATQVSTPQQVQAFSVIPPQTINEAKWIDAVVKKSHIRHSYLPLELENIAEVTDQALQYHDEPFQSSSCIYQFLLRRKIAEQGIKVLLVGEGGDEILAGYRRLLYPYLYCLKKAGRLTEFDQTLTGAVSFMEMDQDVIIKLLDQYIRTISSGTGGQENQTAYTLINPDFITAYQDVVLQPQYPKDIPDPGEPFSGHLRQHLTQWDIPYVLRMEDRNSMAYGIEARVPFLDHTFLEYVFSHDYGEFMKAGRNKAMLRKAMQPLLPQSVLERRSKSPRPGNNAHFIYHLLCEPMLDLLGSPRTLLDTFLNPGVARLFEADRQKKDTQRAESWFRVYLLVRWLELNQGIYQRTYLKTVL
ncbi:MAG: asparagine synthase (glutamine-hydrolyzing) [Sedimentisphaerales bacterium]|nr:asparagine synthase (glutamine-hydrolyzing) [Sedimentisphaerales bacterium]